jgi:hypothetical protein
MKYRVTGGADGKAGIDVGPRRYEPGDIVEMTQPKAAWLIDRGLLEPANGKGTVDEPEVEEPATDLADEIDALDALLDRGDD